MVRFLQHEVCDCTISAIFRYWLSFFRFPVGHSPLSHWGVGSIHVPSVIQPSLTMMITRKHRLIVWISFWASLFCGWICSTQSIVGNFFGSILFVCIIWKRRLNAHLEGFGPTSEYFSRIYNMFILTKIDAVRSPFDHSKFQTGSKAEKYRRRN